MQQKKTFQITAVVALIFSLGFVVHWLIAGPHKPTQTEQTQTPHEPELIRHAEPESIRQAEEEFATAMKFESLGDLNRAIEKYESLKKAFPHHPTIDYSIGICRQKQGKSAEAVEAFRRIAVAPEGPKEIVEDAKARIQKLLLPELTPMQQTYLDMAIEYLRTGEDLKEQAPPMPTSNAHVLPIEHAIRYLEILQKEKPDYIPLYFRLGIAYEFLGRHLDAYYAYMLYLNGYDKFQIPFGNQQHEIRRRLLVCETALRLGANQAFVKTHGASGQFLAHKTVANLEAAQLSSATSPEDQAAARLKISFGIADQTDVSLESGVKPGHYLRPSAPGSEELIFGPANEEPAKKESVFKVMTGLGSQDSGWISFESRSRPNWFIIAGPGGKLFLRSKADTDAFRQSATFRILGPSNPAVPVKP